MYQTSAVLLMAVFYCIYYVKLFSQQRVGIQTNQIKSQCMGVQRHIGIMMSLATVSAPVAELTAIFLNTSSLPGCFRNAGFVLAVLADAVFLLAVVTMGSSWRAGVGRAQKTHLVTGGIYSISRNPAFLAFDCLYTGILMMFFSWWHLIFALFAVIMLHLQTVFVEEPFLSSAFGEEYLTYRKRVCRYLGRKF